MESELDLEKQLVYEQTARAIPQMSRQQLEEFAKKVCLLNLTQKQVFGEIMRRDLGIKIDDL